MKAWRAGCGESRTSGSEGGPEKPAGGNACTALRSDPYTYVPTWSGFLFLAVVLDAFSRRIVGWAMANHLRTSLVLGALNMALFQRKADEVTLHSDQGAVHVIGIRSALPRGRCETVDGLGW